MTKKLLISIVKNEIFTETGIQTLLIKLENRKIQPCKNTGWKRNNKDSEI
jgi:hypothetical protein